MQRDGGYAHLNQLITQCFDANAAQIIKAVQPIVLEPATRGSSWHAYAAAGGTLRVFTAGDSAAATRHHLRAEREIMLNLTQSLLSVSDVGV